MLTSIAIRPRKVNIIILMLALFLIVSPAYAASIKLNGPLIVDGDVSQFTVSPDGQYVVYLADQEMDQVRELYSVPITGGTSSKLNGPIVAGGNVFSSFVISPDSQYVIYRADQDIDNVLELYSVPIDGSSTAVKLNASLPVGSSGVRSSFHISPDSNRVIYLADQNTPTVAELYSVAITGGSTTKLNDPLVADGQVLNYRISSDSTTVVYRADQETDGVTELFSVPLSGGTVRKLNPTLVAGGRVREEFAISANNSHVVYMADQIVDNEGELFSVPITGGPATKLNAPLAANGDVDNFVISLDSSRVVYRAAQDTTFVEELYSVPLSGGSPTKLNQPPETDNSVLEEFFISPDSSRVLYSVGEDGFSSAPVTLYSVPLAGPANASILLTEAVTIEESSERAINPFGLLLISPDSKYVVYPANTTTDETLELYSIPLAGPATANVKLNEPLADGSSIEEEAYQISPDSKNVVYVAAQTPDTSSQLYRTAITGGTSTQLNDPLVAQGRVIQSEISPNGNWVVYRATQDDPMTTELYIVDDIIVGFTTESASIAENADTATISVTLNAPALTPVTVDYTVTGGTATNGADYILADGQLTIPPGQPGGEITVSILEDDLIEDDETVEITLSNPTNATLSTDMFTLTIADAAGNTVYLPMIVR